MPALETSLADMVSVPIAACRCPEAQLVTARSYLVDRFAPDCEQIRLPPKEVHGGTLQFRLGEIVAGQTPPSGLAARLKAALPQSTRRIDGSVLIDLRRKTPENFAHFLNNHLPVVFHLSAELGLAWEDLLLLTPAKTPGYIAAAADLFGLRTHATDDKITGHGVEFDLSPWTAMRPVRAAWARNPAVTAALAGLSTQTGALPERVFLSRRKTRMLSNQAEIEEALDQRGFVTIYPEDISVSDQMRLFQEAETIVAIHGAALAPLLYAPPDGRLHQIVELMPCGHMTDVYRVMSDHVGCGWIGVRGKIKPDYVTPAYDLGTAFKAFSLDSFEIDIASLDRAFALVEQG